MDRRFLTVLGVSLLFALVISSVFYQMAARAGSPKKAAEATDLKDIVLAARPLSVGTTVKPADIKLGKTPSSAFPKGAFAKPEEVIDRPLISNVLMDEPVLEGRLAARGSGVGLAPVIPVGMRAVTLRVNDVTGIAGFVLPGMRVDVLVTGHPPNSENSVTATPVQLQNLLVLSAGTVMQPDARGQAMPAPTVTLLGTPEQAETLTLASADARIQLVLRNGSDQTIEKTPGRDIAELYGERAVHKKVPENSAPSRPRPRPVVVAAAPPPPPPPPDQIVVIRGTTKSVEVVGLGAGGGK
ncbi:MAG TPA: Flp pilus assembly protein CpaB [Bryobacteraceae bacterium]|jgi:pilus assembly protein CpaB|nr:Flp pilus assembly protein CpaB [Bryobacteraceae bacterium]